MTKKTDKQQIVFNITPMQGSLLRQFHREILTSDDIEVQSHAFSIIFDREESEIYPHELIIMKEFCRSWAGEWGSPDLEAPTKGVTTRRFGLIAGGQQ